MLTSARAQLLFGMVVLGLGAIGACSGVRENPRRAGDGGPGGDAGPNRDGAIFGRDVGPCMSADVNGDGIADFLEPSRGTNPDEDGDTIDNRTENLVRTLFVAPNMPIATPPVCSPDDCDNDTIPNFRDLDSDNDGLSDQQEAVHHTNECLADTDGDGVSDLVEVAAGTDPLDPRSMPPATSLYVTIPYWPPSGPPGEHPMRMFSFSTRIQLADVFILVDNSASMGPIINALRSTFSSTIVPGIRAAIPDARIGVGSFDSVPDNLDGSPGDYTLWIRQRVDANAMLSQNALNVMNTIDVDSRNRNFGGDYAECQVEAMFECIAGSGMNGHETDENARISVHNALDPRGDGWVPRMDPVRDCGAAPDGAQPFGWACFADGRVPIIVIASDAQWYNGFASSAASFPPMPRDPNMHSGAQLVQSMMMHGAYFVGVDVGNTGDTYNNSLVLARMTGTVDGSGAPIAFHPGASGLAGAATNIVNAVGTLAGHTPQDITTRTDPDRTETRLPAPHTTADFIRAVTPDHATPDAPTGYSRKDTTTFYAVAPSTIVWFNVDFYNDFQPSTTTTQLFRATIQVLGRAHSIVDHRDVYMIIPPTGGTPPPS